MPGAVQGGDTLDGEQVRADAGDAGSHPREHEAELLDVGLAGRVVDGGGASGEHCCHDDVGRAGHGGLVQEHVAAGKAVFTGSTDLKMLEASVNKVLLDLKAIGQDVYDNPKTEIQNMVSSADLGSEVNLNTTAITLGLEKVEYEPEQFPGLVYRINDPKVVILLFGSGKIVIAGAKRLAQARTHRDNRYAQ